MSGVTVPCATAALAVEVEGVRWWLGDFTVGPGQWVAVVPREEVAGGDLAVAVARVLATLVAPVQGALEVLGSDPQRLSYLELQALRRRIGLVQSWGGLLSNRTIAENVALPARVHGAPHRGDGDALAAELLAALGLAPFAEARPHQVDRLTGWRARVARALILQPAWLVVEGIGDWEGGGSAAWSALAAAVAKGAAAAVCLARPAPAFQSWLLARGGGTVSCHRGAPSVGTGREERR